MAYVRKASAVYDKHTGLNHPLMFAPAGPIKNYIIVLLVVIISIDAVNIILEGIKAVKITLTGLNN